MKNYQLKLILAFFIFGLIIITVMGLVCASVFQLNQPKMIAIIVIALVILAIVCIAMAFFTVKKVIEPMSRMLKGAVSYRYFDYNASENGNDEIENLVADLRKSLMEANSQKRQTDTILKHMTDGVIAFDMKGNVTYINPAAKQMLELRDTDDNFAKVDDMRKEFVADVSHELKTPLTSIKGFSEILLEGDCDKETEKHFLTIINDNADRMEKLVQDLLTLSRYDSKKNKNSIVEFDLGELAKKCTEKFEIEVRKRNQSLECFVTADVPPVQADKDGIERVIINIISNSVKYTPNGGKINVYVGYVHNDAYVKIKDTGIGIPKDDLDKVFERFYRVDKARSRKLGGTGLGLSIAKEIIEQNNGNINVSSKVGQGTEVVIRIPVKKS